MSRSNSLILGFTHGHGLAMSDGNQSRVSRLSSSAQVRTAVLRRRRRAWLTMSREEKETTVRPMLCGGGDATPLRGERYGVFVGHCKGIIWGRLEQENSLITPKIVVVQRLANVPVLCNGIYILCHLF
jgi:hypothetical protein